MYDYVCIPGHFFLLITVLAWIYARSDFLCSRELENAHSCLDGRVFTLFFPGKYAHNFGFKMYKLKKCQKR